MGSVRVIFPTLVYTENMSRIFTATRDIFEQKSLEYKQNFKGVTDWECYSTAGVVNLIEEEIFEELIRVCTHRVNIFASEYNVHGTVKCCEAWINVNSPGDYQEFHIHEYTAFSAVYYVKTPLNSGILELLKGSEFFNINPTLFNNNNSRTINSRTREVFTPHEHDLIIFRSDLPHRVSKNNSSEDRISISMNFVIEPSAPLAGLVLP